MRPKPSTGCGMPACSRRSAAARPRWKRGLEAVDKYVDANRDRRDFHDHYADLSDFLTQIALGAAHSAETSKERELARTCRPRPRQSQPAITRTAKCPRNVAARIQAAFTKAQDAIVEQGQFSAKIAEIEKANADRQPMVALAARRSLLALYPEVAGDPRLAKLLEKTLNVENRSSFAEDPGLPAGRRKQASTSAPHLCLVLNTRSHTEESAGTRPVFVLAKDCCYAVDHVTGEPIWRRVIGLDSPFLPSSVATSEPGLLLFDTNHLSLVSLSRQTGKLIWEQPINEPVSGAPLDRSGTDLSARRRGITSTRSTSRRAVSCRGWRFRRRSSRLPRWPATTSGSSSRAMLP